MRLAEAAVTSLRKHIRRRVGGSVGNRNGCPRSVGRPVARRPDACGRWRPVHRPTLSPAPFSDRAVRSLARGRGRAAWSPAYERRRAGAGRGLRPRLVVHPTAWRLPVGTSGAQQQVAPLEGALSQSAELQDPACTCAPMTEGPRGGNIRSSGTCTTWSRSSRTEGQTRSTLSRSARR